MKSDKQAVRRNWCSLYRCEYQFPQGANSYVLERQRAMEDFAETLLSVGAVQLREERTEAGWKLTLELKKLPGAAADIASAQSSPPTRRPENNERKLW